MPQQNEPPRPHGDPLEDEIVENNQGQQQSDAPEDAEQLEDTSTFDEAEGERRRKHYEGGAELVSKID